MTFQVQQVVKSEPWQSAHGPMFGFTLAGLLDGQIVSNAQINAKTPDAFVPGQVLDVYVDKPDTGYGPKLKKTPQGMPQVQALPTQYPGIGYAQSMPSIDPRVSAPLAPQQAAPPVNADPRQNSIERQSSLAQAVAYCSQKADIYIAMKKPEEALKYFEGAKVMEVAHWFKMYVEKGLPAKEGLPKDKPNTPEDLAMMGDPGPREDPFEDAGEYA